MVLDIMAQGPAKNLVKALRAHQPDCILLEMPADSESALEFIGANELIPPVALLVYDPKDFSRASYLPFAHFSPEWQACLYASKHSVPVIPMDLPIGQQLTLRQANREISSPSSTITAEDQKIAKDPLGYIAALDGYEDGERWWEIHFEQRENNTDIFLTITKLMMALRENVQPLQSKMTLTREAYMRKTLRKQLKTYQKIAVVCGAWHVPALKNWEKAQH